MLKRINPYFVRAVCGLCLFALLGGLQKLAVATLVISMLICGATCFRWRL